MGGDRESGDKGDMWWRRWLARWRDMDGQQEVAEMAREWMRGCSNKRVEEKGAQEGETIGSWFWAQEEGREMGEKGRKGGRRSWAAA
ncbi:hypothetical protein AMTR_s00128p00030550 [Amborella trichopoda]|uniref:Uncharacterized protein n=1 Tax=Amborella trichopoda TaxID=13333 RepID=W1NPE9_AMBTC|nr:hypothetical protein AMTR_s00128p00030550 [Amborella trichopoda]